MKEKQFDLRIGLYEKYEAVICPFSGQSVKGEHSSTMRIVGNYYFRMLSKVQPTPLEKETVKQELLKIVLQAESKDTKVVKNDKQSK